MLHIRYKLGPSTIHGIGVFSEEDIPKDCCIVTASPLLDTNLSQEQFDTLSATEQEEVKHHGHYDKVLNRWHVDFDMTRFANHSDSPNLTQKYNDKGYYILALKDIKKGEELTINYDDFEIRRKELI
ncbi:MAG: SET domain-containing protein [Candidatus Pacebacteria bacterium]|nr:SET domain-containing protein [Candidatus Paceibacterota bacterium]